MFFNFAALRKEHSVRWRENQFCLTVVPVPVPPPVADCPIAVQGGREDGKEPVSGRLQTADDGKEDCTGRKDKENDRRKNYSRTCSKLVD